VSDQLSPSQIEILNACMSPEEHTRLLVWGHSAEDIDWLLDNGYLRESKRQPGLYVTSELGAQESHG
jgi:hypothetical protein